MACRLRGADDVRQYWAALTGAVDGISRRTTEQLLARGADPEYVRRDNFVPAMASSPAPGGSTGRSSGTAAPRRRRWTRSSACSWNAPRRPSTTRRSTPSGSRAGSACTRGPTGSAFAGTTP
ncbi:hypothetical protein V1460_18175 [Streptomyces sp. SCSIO 30461]|uniref:hypothetical protein n=1 Tax=Streptomyces sp. SCSIO 30461 TaxID=3118085 RepID=UPI0030CD7DD4